MSKSNKLLSCMNQFTDESLRLWQTLFHYWPWSYVVHPSGETVQLSYPMGAQGKLLPGHHVDLFLISL